MSEIIDRKVRRRRSVKSRRDEPEARDGGMEVQTIRMGMGQYVQRYTSCGKECNVCSPAGAHFDRVRPGHGPYWYWEHTIDGRKVRRYVGRDLMSHLAQARRREIGEQLLLTFGERDALAKRPGREARRNGFKQIG